MTGEKGGLLACLRAEALKSRHAAPVRLAVLMALPMPLLGAMPYRGVQIFSAWNYWYALFLPVSLSLVVACVARADARTRMRGLLGLGFPLRRAWWAKALWCLALCALSNLVVFGIYLAGSAFSSQGLTVAGTLTMLLCALVNTVTAAWMIPAGLFLTARLGMLAGIFCPLATQLVGGFAWSLMPLPQLFPPSASMVIPTSFIPVLPSGEPLAADMALGGALAADGMLTLAGLAVCALAFAALTAAGAADARRGHGPRCRGRARGPARPNRPGASRREPRGQRRRARALARDGLLRRRGRTPRHRGVRRRTGLLSRRPRTRLRAPLHRRLLPLLARRRPPLRARPPCRLQGRERPRGLRLARQQPLGRRGGHHRGPPVRGLTTQALAPACLATKRFHLETRGVNRETAGERE